MDLKARAQLAVEQACDALSATLSEDELKKVVTIIEAAMRDAVQAAFRSFHKGQMQRQVSGVSYFDAREAPPAWPRVGDAAWAAECDAGCAWCCLLTARWQLFSLTGEPDTAQGYLDRACEIEPQYCDEGASE